MKRNELGKVLDCIKNDDYVRFYRASKDSPDIYGEYIDLENVYGYYESALNFVLGICTVLRIDNLITDSQVEEMLDATREYMNTGLSGRLDALFDKMRKGARK